MSRIPWWTPALTGDEAREIARALDANYVNEGPIVREFEAEVARIWGARFAVATTSGTAAIYLALKAAGVGPSDEVVVPDLTMIATANAARMTGADVVLADVDPSTGLLTAGTITDVLTARTRAVVPVHVSGRPCRPLGYIEAALGPRVAIVEDACEAVPDGRPSPRTRCLSFSPHKIATTGQGGAVLTDDDEVAAAVWRLRNHGLDAPDAGAVPSAFDRWGTNLRMTDLQAAVGIAQLRAVPDRIVRLRRNAELYRTELDDFAPQVELPLPMADPPLWIDVWTDRRDALALHLDRAGIGTRRYWRPLHEAGHLRADAARFPGAIAAAGRGLWLPSSYTLTDAAVRRICDEIEAFVDGVPGA